MFETVKLSEQNAMWYEMDQDVSDLFINDGDECLIQLNVKPEGFKHFPMLHAIYKKGEHFVTHEGRIIHFFTVDSFSPAAVTKHPSNEGNKTNIYDVASETIRLT